MLDEQLKTNLRVAYDNNSGKRNASGTQDWKKNERQFVYDYIKQEGKTSLLEVGAGTGKDSEFFNHMGLDTLSTDLSPESVELCKEKGLNAEVMSFDCLDLPESSYDSVWAMNCLLHVPKQQLHMVLNEIKRVLRTDGILYIGIYGGKNSEGVWEDDFHEPKRFFSFYEDDEIKTVLGELFRIESFNTVPADVVGGPFHFQSFILRKI